MIGRSLYVLSFSIAVIVVGIATALLFLLSPSSGKTATPTPVPVMADGTVPASPVLAWSEIGTDPRALTWSADGRMVVFEVPRAFGTVRLMVASVGTDGRATAEALAASGEASGQRFRLMQRPQWDGGRVLFEGTLERSAVRRIYYADPSADVAKPLVSVDEAGGTVVDPVFDARHEHLAFVHNDLQSSEVMILDVRSHRSRTLPAADGEHSAPVFSPDGKALIFARRVGGDTDLFRADVNKGKVEPFAQGAGHQAHPVAIPAQSPDETLIWLMTSSADGKTGDLVAMSQDAARVVEGSIQIPTTTLSVTPDARWVALQPAGQDDVIVLRSPRTDERVAIRTGVHGIVSPTLATFEGRTRLGFVGGDEGARAVYVLDVTDLLPAPRTLTASATPAH